MIKISIYLNAFFYWYNWKYYTKQEAISFYASWIKKTYL